MIAVNCTAFMPSVQAIKDKYYKMFRGRGGEGIEDESSGNGGGDGDGSRPMEGDEAFDNLRAHPQWPQ
jgi:hypothetical protein